MEDERLKAHFKFDEADLQANRNGQFSEKQKERLASLVQLDHIGNRILGILLIFSGPAGMAYLSFSNDNLFLRLLFMFIWVIPAFIISLIGVALLYGSFARSKKHRLRNIQGIISFNRHKKREGGAKEYGFWVLSIKTMRFYVSEFLPGIMKAGDEYCLYFYTNQGSSHILTAELITKTEQN